MKKLSNSYIKHKKTNLIPTNLNPHPNKSKSKVIANNYQLKNTKTQSTDFLK